MQVDDDAGNLDALGHLRHLGTHASGRRRKYHGVDGGGRGGLPRRLHA
jgi:hypothetical protein